MSVFTSVTSEELSQWLRRYAIGTLRDLKGIAEGIENTNYFLTTSHGRYVLTLFERMSAAELPFYLNLMSHLARHGIPCPAPIADRDNALFGTLGGKPAAIVTRLAGAPVLRPGEHHCAMIGSVLADMHVAGQSYSAELPNPRGLAWWVATAPKVLPFLDGAQRALLESEIGAQCAAERRGLPSGPIHGDLFRDNALWDGQDGGEMLGGVIDFYFAGSEALLFDVAVTLNDWCINADGTVDPRRSRAMLSGYADVRRFTAEERAAWPLMVRAAALRFWLSRLFDFHLPRPGDLTHAHDPEHFRRILEARRAHAPELGG